MRIEKTNYYKQIDGLRAFAAIGVVLMHVQTNMTCEFSGFMFEKLIPSFTDNVFLFMVISGFSTCCGYFDKITTGQITLERFYRKRFVKVWPFFALLNLLDLLVSPSKEPLLEALANLTLCFGLIPDHRIEVIGVGWFLGVVFVFYFLFPFFCYLLSSKKRAWFSFGISLLLNYLCEVYFQTGRMNIAYSAVFFMLGGLIYLYRKPLQAFTENCGLAVLIAIAGAAVWYYALEDGTLAKLALSGLLLIYALGERMHKINLLDNKITAFFSGISMEIYLCHMVVFRILEQCIPGNIANHAEVLLFLIMAVGTIAGAVVFSCVCKALLSNFCAVIHFRR